MAKDDPKIAEQRRLKRVFEACSRLISNADFKVFVDEYLVEELLRQRDSNDELTGEALVRGQGASRTYREILRTIDQSPAFGLQLRQQEARRVRGDGKGLG